MNIDKIKNFITKKTIYIIIFLVSLNLVLSFFSLKNDSATSDEVAHITSGYSFVKKNDMRLDPSHPPLAKYFSTLPLIFLDLNFIEGTPEWETNLDDIWNAARLFFYESGNNPDTILLFSRIPMLLIMIIGAISIYLITLKITEKKRDFVSKTTALLAMTFFLFSPNIITHGRFMTTDMPVIVFTFLSIWFFAKYYKKNCWKNFLLSALFLAIAQAVKYSAFILIFVYFLIISIKFFIESYKNETKKDLLINFGKNLLSYTGMVFLSLIIIAFIYWPGIYKTPEAKIDTMIDEFVTDDFPQSNNTENVLHLINKNTFTRNFVLYFLGIGMQFGHVEMGHDAYFMGEYSNSGWWYFFPVLFLTKVPIILLFLFFLAIIIFIKKINFSKKDIFKKTQNYIKKHFFEFSLLIFVFVYLTISITGSLNLGIRHLLPIFPAMYIFISKEIIYAINNFKKKRIFKLNFKTIQNSKIFLSSILSLIIFSYIYLAIFIFPYYLSYFNFFGGGSNNGYLIAVDSNYDWGQDLKRLETWLNERNIQKITVDYFGGGNTNYYLNDKIASWNHTGEDAEGWFAISASKLQWHANENNSKGKLYKKLRDEYTPIDTINKSILIYYIPKNK